MVAGPNYVSNGGTIRIIILSTESALTLRHIASVSVVAFRTNHVFIVYPGTKCLGTSSHLQSCLSLTHTPNDWDNLFSALGIEHLSFNRAL
jgi:hypothetical protein